MPSINDVTLQGPSMNDILLQGSPINHVTVIAGGGQVIYAECTKILVLEGVTIVRKGVKDCPKLNDVIYGRPLGRNLNKDIWTTLHKLLLSGLTMDPNSLNPWFVFFNFSFKEYKIHCKMSLIHLFSTVQWIFKVITSISV